MKLTGNESTGYILRELGNRIRDTRIALPMTREELAEKAGVSLSTVVRLEGGRNIGSEQIINVMRALNVLHGIDVFIPEYTLTPVDIANGKAKRKRASSVRQKKTTEWKWGDEEKR